MTLFRRRSSQGPETTPSDTLNPDALDGLRRAGGASVAEVLTSPEGRDRIRAVWAQIDVATTGTTQPRLFAGISNDGQRIFEVYGDSQTGSDVFAVMIGDLSASAPDTARLQVVRGDETTKTRNVLDRHISFEDPDRAPGRRTELLVRQASQDGTSSLYSQSGMHQQDVWPMAYIQATTQFDADPGSLRVSQTDDRSLIEGGLRVNTPPPVVHSFDEDDLAL